MTIDKDALRLFSVRSVADSLSISRSAVYNLLKAGKLESVKIGKSRRVTASQLSDFLDSLHGQE